MKPRILYIILLLFATCMINGCKDDQEIFFEEHVKVNDMDRIHPNERDKPYPREEHELYINPSPLIVPNTVREKDEFLEFELSQNKDFPENGTFRSGKLSWNIYNVHRKLEEGEWYWRFRVIDAKGKADVWSEVNKFKVNGNIPVFVTPEWKVFQQNIPDFYPRIHFYLNEDLEKVRPNIINHSEYATLLGRNNSAMRYEAQVSDLYDEGKTSTLNTYVFDYLYSTYLLTGEKQYYDKLMDYGNKLLSSDIDETQCAKSNFHAAYVVTVLSTIYDACNETLSESQKKVAEDVIVYLVNKYYVSYTGKLENHIFDNHTWQKVIRGLLHGAFIICQKYPEMMTSLEYFYEIWTARAPASGFNRDGAWMNGSGYFNVNLYTLYYIPMLFSKVTGIDFFKHPWYQNVGKALIYSWLPGTSTTGFGDIGNPEDDPNRQRVAFADMIAREMGDSYAAWYVKECGDKVLRDDFTFRLYRMSRDYITYGGEELSDEDFENYVWYKDIGEGVASSNMLDRTNNLALGFRSSPFGSGSHTLADQNSFKLTYKGYYIYMNAGYYQDFQDAHNLLQYRNTRGHNTIMINNIGQPFTTRAYGNIVQSLNGKNLAYFQGDASNAYCGVSEYSMWQDAFEKAGLAQVPAYGFGDNPLNCYKRHIFMLRPNKIIIYDDLGADEPATWQWLLHSTEEFNVTGNKITTHYENSDKGGSVAVSQIYSNIIPDITTTNEWFPGGEPTVDPNVPKQWHLTANFPACDKNRILTVIQVGNTEDDIQEIWRVDNSFYIGDWTVEAEMNAGSPAKITISNKTTGTIFDYGSESPVINGAVYQRQADGTSLLYDEVNGAMTVQEISDKPALITRSMR